MGGDDGPVGDGRASAMLPPANAVTGTPVIHTDRELFTDSVDIRRLAVAEPVH